MIANQPAKFCISLIHLSIALFCFSFCVGFTLADKEGSFLALIKSNDFFAVLVCFLVGIVALVGFIFWQRDDSKNAKKTSYLVSFLILIQYLVITLAEQKMKVNLVLGLFLFPPILLIFLLGVSEMGKESKKYQIAHDTILDSDFLEPFEIPQTTNYFFKTNRIIAIFLGVGAIMMVLNNLFNRMPDAFIPVYVSLLVVSFFLLVLPKLGSWIAYIALNLLALGVFGGMIYLLFFQTKDVDNNFDKIVFAVSTVSSVSFFFIGIAMLLFSKEAKEERK
ncbi:hypothetical protein [Bernardetia sp.]|uniref:hypothetical protein n=1 Tax=Bernardetia sp. TaxID=1937974 RepID=UPI0025C60D25|nr:hypothetical protein [Bernardetia sp.]